MVEEKKEKTLRNLIQYNNRLSDIILTIAEDIESLESNEKKEKTGKCKEGGSIRAELTTTGLDLDDTKKILECIYNQLKNNNIPKEE